MPEADALEDAARDLDEHGLRASALQVPCYLSEPDVVERVSAYLPAFEHLRAPIMLLTTESAGIGFESACDRLRDIAERASAFGVTVAIEFHPDLATNADVARRTIDTIAHDHLRLNFDTANIDYYNQRRDYLDELQHVLPYLASIHLKDGSRKQDDRDFPALGDGKIDFGAIIRCLRMACFKGPLTIEIAPADRDQRTESDVLDAMRRSVAHIRSCGLIADH